MIIRVYRCLYVWMRHWKMHALLASVSRAQLITSWVENRLLAWVRYSKPIQFHSSPLNILPVQNWLNVKFHYFLPGPKAKILNTLTPLAPFYVMLFPVSKPMRTPSRVLLVALNVQAWLICYTPQQDLRCLKEVYNVKCSKKVPKPLILTLTNSESANSLYPP